MHHSAQALDTEDLAAVTAVLLLAGVEAPFAAIALPDIVFMLPPDFTVRLPDLLQLHLE